MARRNPAWFAQVLTIDDTKAVSHEAVEEQRTEYHALFGIDAGDALIEVSVEPHAFFRREGRDVYVELPVTLKEAVLGAKVEVPTISGPVHLTVPANSTSGTKLRLKGRGIKGGNQFVTLKVMLPTDNEAELAEFLKNWTPHHDFDPRKHMGGK